MEILLVPLGWLLWSLCNGLIAHDQGRGFGWWAFGSLVVSPLLVWLYLVASPSPDSVARQLRTIELLESLAQDVKNESMRRRNTP